MATNKTAETTNKTAKTKNKTAETKQDVSAFINSFADTDQKRKDSFALIKLMTKVSGFEPVMWGPSIIGFGKYHSMSFS